MPNQPKTVARTVRVDADVWAAARIKALTAGETVSDVVRRALDAYTANNTEASSFDSDASATLDRLMREQLDRDRNDVPPGRCGVPYPYAEVPYSCELLAGHRGMHQCNDWRSIPAGQIGTPQITTWTGSTSLPQAGYIA